MKIKLLSVMLAASMLKSNLVDADHLPRLQQKMEGNVLNIWCWNEEFQRYFNDYYPDVRILPIRYPGCRRSLMIHTLNQNF